MDKSFGEYLVKKGVLDANTLAEALLQQIKNTPSVAELVWQSKLLSAEQFIQTIVHQSKNRSGFISACRELGYWSDPIEHSILETLGKSSTPLIKILVEKKVLQLDQLNKYLDEYISDAVVAEKPKPVPQEESTPASPSPGNSATLEFEEQFNSGGKQFLIDWFSELDDVHSRQLASVFLKRVGGAATFAKFSKLQSVFDVMEKSIESLQASPGVDRTKLTKSLLELLESAWVLRCFSVKNNSESDFSKTHPEEQKLLDLRLELLRRMNGTHSISR